MLRLMVVALVVLAGCGTAGAEDQLPDVVRAAKVLADALSTPPDPVPKPLWTPYVWQSLIGSALALAAAAATAWVIMRQTRAMVRATIRAAATQARAVHRQIEAENRRRAEDAENERRQIAAAIASEIRALTDLVERRKIQEAYEHIAKQEYSSFTGTMKVFPVRGPYFVVFNALSAKLGTLPTPLPVYIARTYTLANGTLDTLRAIGEGQYNTVNFHDATKLATELARDLRAVKEMGRYVASILEHYSNTGSIEIPAEGSKADTIETAEPAMQDL